MIDKPIGPTSHDIVARLRKVLNTRAIGHAGTLDPAATGVLVVAVGEATKLSSYLTAEDKEYRATVTFGASTATLDADGDVVATGPIPGDLIVELSYFGGAAPTARPENGTPLLARALDTERARQEQLPPAFSAIKTGGRAAYELARRGKEVCLLPRPVTVSRLEITAATPATVDLVLVVSKGYYVRALARDLGETLGVPAHLSSLRRVASGAFTLDEALPWSASCAELERAMQAVEHAAARVLPVSRLTEEGQRRAGYGQLLLETHFVEPPVPAVSAWFGQSGELVAIGRPAESGGFTVERGFTHATSTAST
ncbi:MAG TPA: tRNA pseudouridine(55) synthase TruB [Polyangiaceae bacterium]|nr:tRNA pseudouridine(55) synthase TruB [Polyangiaceae bacterium]